MPDLLVKLYDLKDDWSFIQSQADIGITIRKPIGPEKHNILKWVKENFGIGWASETDVAFSNVPRTCFVAEKDRQFLGFSCYDATALGFFGPIGVHAEGRGKGTGKALLLACMLDMKLKGYGYSIVGDASHEDWYAKCVGAMPIDDSKLSVYKNFVQES